MFKKNSPHRPTPRHFKEPAQKPAQEQAHKSAQEPVQKPSQEQAQAQAQKMPPNCKSGFPEDINTLISELEMSLENLQEAIRQGESVLSKAAAAFSGDGDG